MSLTSALANLSVLQQQGSFSNIGQTGTNSVYRGKMADLYDNLSSSDKLFAEHFAQYLFNTDKIATNREIAIIGQTTTPAWRINLPLAGWEMRLNTDRYKRVKAEYDKKGVAVNPLTSPPLSTPVVNAPVTTPRTADQSLATTPSVVREVATEVSEDKLLGIKKPMAYYVYGGGLLLLIIIAFFMFRK